MKPLRHWSDARGRSTGPVMRLMVRLSLTGGRAIAYPVLHGIVLYFMVFSRGSRRYSRTYLRRVLNRRPTWRDVYRHHWVFACTLLDRVYLLADRSDGIDVEINASPEALHYLTSGPSILLGSHLGSFEVLRRLGEVHPALSVRPMMYRERGMAVDAVLREVNPALHDRVIEIGGFDSLLRAREAVEAGETLALLGDRAMPGARSDVCRLLGDEVSLPVGPLLLAHGLGVPVLLCFGLYKGWGRYEAHFELFAERLRLPRGEARDSALRDWLQRYADRLAYHCRRAPYNWFNFYDFWNELPQRDVPAEAAQLAVPRARRDRRRG